MEFNESTDYLEHYGVLGMHWGVRKDGKPQGFQYGKRNKKNKESREEARSNRSLIRERDRQSQNRRRLSDEELDRSIARLKKEKELRTLTNEANHPTRTRIQSDLADVLASSGKKIAIAALTAGGAALITYIIASNTDDVKETVNRTEVAKDVYKSVMKPKK